jgi:hypothetical protein
MPTISRSLTLTATGGFLNVIKTKCHISEAFDMANTTIQPPTYSEFMAIWDTGATASVITQKVVDSCGLHPIGMVEVHGVNSKHLSEVYLVNILLPNQVTFAALQVTKGQLTGDSDVLIGMDVIHKGDFAITNMGHTVFSFRVPSQVTIDFVKEHNNKILPLTSTHGSANKPREKRKKKYGKNK